jgi:RNA polymerase sigma factor (sigma-70 family)
VPDYSRRNALVEQHFRLIRPIALSIRRNLPPNFHLDDLEQLGALGLLRAAEQCDPSKCFVSYAKAKIRGAILDGIRREIAAGMRTEDANDGESFVAAPPREEIQAVRHAMEALTDRQRQALLLRLDGETRPSAGRQLGVTASAVKDLERRAIANLRKRLPA